VSAGPVERLRLSTRSAVLAVLALFVTTALLGVLAAAHRVLGWVLTAAAVAGLLHPLLSTLSRRLPRALAVALVVFGSLGIVGGTAYVVVEDVVAQTRVLQREAPELARRLEDSESVGKAAREAELSERTGRFVEEVPERLRGGTPAEALRAATTRGLAFLATSVLTLFFLLHGPRIAQGAARQIHDAERRAKAERVAWAAYSRGFGYARGTLILSVLAALLAYGLARWANVPGPAPLAIWVGLWDLVPLLGVAVGAAPIVVLAWVIDPTKGFIVAAVVLGWQLLEDLVLQRRIERATVRVGPFLTTLAGIAGLELYGLGGALMLVLAVALAAAAADEWLPRSTGRSGGVELSDKHGARMDEALKTDNDTKTQEFRQEAEPVVEQRIDVPQQNPGVMDDAEADRRTELARFLDPSAFPARPTELLERAERHFAPEWVLGLLARLPDETYENTQQVWVASGGQVEEKRA
jgi:predicted PurR-regulated permease PerM